MYKKVLVILHDSILPHMSQPTLLIDFLTAAYDVGESHVHTTTDGLFTDLLDLTSYFCAVLNGLTK